MMIELVATIDERLQRYREYGFEFFPGDMTVVNYLAHLKGLDSFCGKKVLEIGAEDGRNTSEFFQSRGTEYFAVRIGGNSQGHSYILPQQDFMDLPEDAPYDLIISNGVFDQSALDRRMGGERIFSGRSGHLTKLHLLTKPGGFNVHGTITDPFMFSCSELEEIGFEMMYKTRPFRGFDLQGYSALDAESELVVLRRVLT